MSDERLEGLRAAVELSPDNQALRLVLAEALAAEDEGEEALEHYALLLDAGALPTDELVRVGTLAVGLGRLQIAARCLEAARRAGAMSGTAALEDQLTDALVDGGVARPAVDPDEPPPLVAEPVAAEEVTFDQVGGLESVKKAIHRTIVLPFQRPDLYERYGRRAGGGVLLYGPPGCGKTLLARATAGECGVPFLNVRMEDVLDPMYGVSERRLHDAFTDARLRAPCVLFIDELDAIAFARRKQRAAPGARSSTSCCRSSTRSAPTTRACWSSPRPTRRGTSTTRSSGPAASTASSSSHRPTCRRDGGSSSSR